MRRIVALFDGQEVGSVEFREGRDPEAAAHEARTTFTSADKFEEYDEFGEFVREH